MLPQLAAILEAIRYDALPEATVEKTKTTILNFLGTGLLGAHAPAARAAAAAWAAQGTAGACTVLGHRGRFPALAAASVNALMGQVFLLEDCHEHTISHPGVTAIPVALALGQDAGAHGRRVIEAVVAGYEAIGRIGAVLIAPGFPAYGLRPASTLAPFGAAATAAKLLGLDAGGIRAALSIAGNTASGVMEFVNSGAEDICLQNCFAAQNGVMAAQMAALGAGASATILDGAFGLGRALCRRELDWSPALAPRPEYMIDESFIKRYPGCGHVLATAQAAASLVSRYRIDPGDVLRVTVGVSKHARDFPGVDHPGPYSGMISAMMSHQFMAASTLVHGEVSARTVKRYDDDAVARMARKVSVEVDEQAEGAFPHKTGARLSVYLKGGEVLRDYQEDLIPMSREEVAQRFLRGAREIFSESHARELLDKALRLETLESVRELMERLDA